MPRDTHKETFVLPIFYHANLAIKCKHALCKVTHSVYRKWISKLVTVILMEKRRPLRIAYKAILAMKRC